MDSIALQSLMYKEQIMTFILCSIIFVPLPYSLLHLGRQRTAKNCQFCSLREKQHCKARRVIHGKTLGKGFWYLREEPRRTYTDAQSPGIVSSSTVTAEISPFSINPSLRVKLID